MMRHICCLALLGIVLAAGCVHYQPASTQSLVPSEAKLQAKSIDGIRVRLVGVASIRHEDINLWDDKDAMARRSLAQCISFANNLVLAEKFDHLDGKCIEIEGVFDADADENGKMVRLTACNKEALVVDDQPMIRRLASSGCSKVDREY